MIQVIRKAVANTTEGNCNQKVVANTTEENCNQKVVAKLATTFCMILEIEYQKEFIGHNNYGGYTAFPLLGYKWLI